MPKNTPTSTRPQTEEKALEEALKGVDEEYVELMAFLECFDPAAWPDNGE